MKILRILIGLSLISHMGFASETDNFTRRDIKTDAREWLNQQMNQSLQKAIQAAGLGDPSSVHKQLFKILGGLFWAKIEHWADDKTSPAEHLAFEESVFRDVGDVRGNANFVRKLFKFKGYYSSGVYRIDEVVFGADKLGHFFQVGYAMYYAKMKKDDPKFKDVRPLHVRWAEVVTGDKKFHETSELRGDALVYAYSRFQEDNSWGMTGPMARSYGDMAANVEGYHFWSQLTDGEKAYLKMDEKGNWKQVRPFDWAEYVNLAWDEAVNRTDYHDLIKDKVEIRIQQVLRESCNSLPSCTSIFERYGEDVVHVFNVKCQSLIESKK